jgi:hypothetical protein
MVRDHGKYKTKCFYRDEEDRVGLFINQLQYLYLMPFGINKRDGLLKMVSTGCTVAIRSQPAPGLMVSCIMLPGVRPGLLEVNASGIVLPGTLSITISGTRVRNTTKFHLYWKDCHPVDTSGVNFQ